MNFWRCHTCGKIHTGPHRSPPGWLISKTVVKCEICREFETVRQYPARNEMGAEVQPAQCDYLTPMHFPFDRPNDPDHCRECGRLMRDGLPVVRERRTHRDTRPRFRRNNMPAVSHFDRWWCFTCYPANEDLKK